MRNKKVLNTIPTTTITTFPVECVNNPTEEESEKCIYGIVVLLLSTWSNSYMSDGSTLHTNTGTMQEHVEDICVRGWHMEAHLELTMLTNFIVSNRHCQSSEYSRTGQLTGPAYNTYQH